MNETSMRNTVTVEKVEFGEFALFFKGFCFDLMLEFLKRKLLEFDFLNNENDSFVAYNA